MTSERSVDRSVAQIWAALLDEGTYLCSQSTVYRLLRRPGIAVDRRNQAGLGEGETQPVATAVGQVSTCDIIKLRGLARGVHYELYVVIDIYSRYVVV